MSGNKKLNFNEWIVKEFKDQDPIKLAQELERDPYCSTTLTTNVLNRTKTIGLEEWALKKKELSEEEQRVKMLSIIYNKRQIILFDDYIDQKGLLMQISRDGKRKKVTISKQNSLNKALLTF